MKTYLAKFTIYEGEHEHRGEFLVHATSYEEAEATAKSQEHDVEFPDETSDELTYWDYGDATTAARLDGVIELTEDEANSIRRLGLAHNFNELP